MNTIRLSHVTLACALALGTFDALAQPAPDRERAVKIRAELQQRFAAADVNGDGRLTKEEAKDGMPMVYKHFEEIDTARAGSVTPADIAAYVLAHRAKRQSAPAAP